MQVLPQKEAEHFFRRRPAESFFRAGSLDEQYNETILSRPKTWRAA